jgi:hypothetical protein
MHEKAASQDHPHPEVLPLRTIIAHQDSKQNQGHSTKPCPTHRAMHVAAVAGGRYDGGNDTNPDPGIQSKIEQPPFPFPHYLLNVER